MNREDHDHVVEMIELGIHRYFDHYLTDVFPKQVGYVLKTHNQDAEAHRPVIEPLQKSERRVKRVVWMTLGGAAVVGAGIGIFVDHAGAILKAIIG